MLQRGLGRQVGVEREGVFKHGSSVYRFVHGKCRSFDCRTLWGCTLIVKLYVIECQAVIENLRVLEFGSKEACCYSHDCCRRQGDFQRVAIGIMPLLGPRILRSLAS